MSVEKRVSFDEHGEPVVVITIKGWHDAFRFAWAMGHLQCEFADVGRRIGGSLRRRIGAESFRAMQQRFTSRTSLVWARDDDDDDLLERCEKAARALEHQAAHEPVEVMAARLRGKAQGVRLAISFAEEQVL